MGSLFGFALGVWLAGCTAQDPEALLADAQARFDQGDYRTAVILLQNVLQANADDVAARLLFGRIALAMGDVLQARGHLERARALGAAAEVYAVPLANALVLMNEAAAAGTALDAVPAEFRAGDYWLARGRASMMLGEREQAAQAFSTAEEIDGATSDVLVGRARLATIQGDLAEAEALLARALDIDSANPEALVLRGFLAASSGRLEPAEADLRGAAEIYESRFQALLAAPVLLRLVQVQLALNEIELASRTANRLSNASPNAAFADYANGLVSFQQGDFDQTVQLLRVALTKAPDQPQFMTLLGAALLAVGSFGQAEQQFLSVLSRNPSDPAAIRLLVETRIRQERPQAALETLNSIRAADTEQDLGLLLLQGRARLQAGDVDEAIPYLEQAIALNPGNQAVVLQLIRAYIATGRTSQADALLQSSPALTLDETYAANVAVLLGRLQSDGIESGRDYVAGLIAEEPGDARAHMLAAIFHQLTNDDVAAKDALDTVLELDGEFIPAYLALAALLAEEGRLDDAEERLLEAASLESGNVTVLMSLAQLAVRKSDLDGAQAYLARAAEGSETAPPRLALARLHVMRGELDEAETQAGIAATIAPGEPDLLVTQGMIALARSDAEAAVPLLSDALARVPNRPSVALLLAQAHAANQDVESARDTLSAAVERMPAALDLRAALGAAELQLGDSAEALRIAKELQVGFGQQAAGFTLEGRVRMTQRRYDDAAAMYSLGYARAGTWALLASFVSASRLSSSAGGEDMLVREWLEAMPADTRARLLLADLLRSEGRADEALDEYERVLEFDSEHVVALNNAAWFAYEASSPRAIGYAQRAAELAPDNAAVLDTYGWILTREERADEALPYLTRAAQFAAQALEIRYHLAVAQARSGQFEAARETLQSLLSEDQQFAQRDAAQELLETL